MRKSFIAIMTLVAVSTHAQDAWTVQQCMRYAVAHNHEVRQAELELDNYKASRMSAIGRFLPEVDAGIGTQYNFGRAIDPETNGYTNVSTFYNGYSVQASLPVFDGFGRLHALRAAKAGVLMGREALRQQQDQTALNVLQAFVNVVYYEEMVKMAAEKAEETTLLLRQTRLLEEVGRKSAADVAQVESQQAEANYELTRQQNLLSSARLSLIKDMGLPFSDTLSLTVNTSFFRLSTGVSKSADWSQQVYRLESARLPTEVSNQENHSFAHGNSHSPDLLQAYFRTQTTMHEWRQARAALLPALSLSAGLNTTYYHTLHADAGQSFRNQLKNNMGEYVGLTLSIPLFNRLQTLTGIRRAKNNYRIACEAYEQKQLELEKLSREAWQDWQGYQLQAAQMEKKVEADSLAYQLTRRQFEEGLSTAIDLHTTSSQLLQSRATLLQCRLMVMVKEYLVRYYRGEKVWD